MRQPEPVPQVMHAQFPVLAGIQLFRDFRRGRSKRAVMTGGDLIL